MVVNEDEDIHEKIEQAVWNTLSTNAKIVLECLFKIGPIFDASVSSKIGRNELLDKKLAVKICMADGEDGYQALTYLGQRVYKRGRNSVTSN